MIMHTRFQLYDDVRICHLDFTDLLSEDEAVRRIEEAKRVIAREPPKSVYTITDVSGSRVTPRLRSAMAELSQHNEPYVIFGAVVVTTNIQRAILRGIIRFTGRRLMAAESVVAAVAAVTTEARSVSAATMAGR